MRDWSLREAESMAQGHTALSSGWDTSPGFLMQEASCPATSCAASSPSPGTGKHQHSNQLPKTQYGVSALKIVSYILSLID